MLTPPAATATMFLALLAQQSTTQRHMRGVLFWGAVLMVAALAIGFGIRVLRKRVFPAEESPPEQLWSLQDLRNMRERGEVSEEEFETLRARVIARMAGAEGAAQPQERDQADDAREGAG